MLVSFYWPIVSWCQIRKYLGWQMLSFNMITSNITSNSVHRKERPNQANNHAWKLVPGSRNDIFLFEQSLAYFYSCFGYGNKSIIYKHATRLQKYIIFGVIIQQKCFPKVSPIAVFTKRNYLVLVPGYLNQWFKRDLTLFVYFGRS